ncbi:MAG: FAD-binding oxidoreductase [Candidatus Omnitrophica bacterium]|nr:FAD-binding oxidoreductase [Candidatus Omnitrophota bacterium]
MIIKTKKDQFESYLEDTSNLYGTASSLYIVKNKEELVTLIRDLNKHKTPFTISAGRTGTTGGCVPLGGVIISIEQLKSIIEINKENKTVSLETGLTFKELEEAVSKKNLTLRSSPTESLAFIGGAISTCASGVRGFGYGSIRNYISGIEVVLPTGEQLNIKRKAVSSVKRLFDFEHKGKNFKFKLPSYTAPKFKSQAGYFVHNDMDLIDLFIGSEGTLGVIVGAEINLQDMPLDVFDGLIFFKKETEGLEFVEKIKNLKIKKLLEPTSLEFFDKNSLDMLRSEYSFVPQAECAIYFEQAVEKNDDPAALLDKWAGLSESLNAIADKSILADTPKERERIFEFRHRLPQAINEYLRSFKQLKTAVDCAVPPAAFMEMYNFYKEKAKESGINYVNFGHIGEDHLHFNFLPKADSESITAKKYMETFCRKAVELGGTVSAEHGIGKIKKPYLKIMYTQAQIEEMAHLKKYFDPVCLMGLDNIFGKEILSRV